MDTGGEGGDRQGAVSGGVSVSLVARRHGISGSQVFTWRRLMNQGELTAAAAGEEMVPASEYRALEAQGRELHRLLGKTPWNTNCFREALSQAAGPKTYDPPHRMA
jgi:transposase